MALLDPTNLPDRNNDPPPEEDPQPHASWLNARKGLRLFLEGVLEMRDEGIMGPERADDAEGIHTLARRLVDAVEQKAIEAEAQRIQEEWR